MRKSLHELPLKTYQSQKGSDFSVGLRQGELCHSFQVLLAGLNSLLGYMMGLIFDLIVEEFTFTQLEFQVMLSEAFKHNMQALQMLFFGFGKDNNIVQVN